MRTTLPAIAALSLVFGGCVGSPTGPDPPELTHPNEILMQQFLNCNTDHHGISPVALWFFRGERAYFTVREGPNEGKLAFAACRAGRGADYVTCDRRYIRETNRAGLADPAAHEVAHITGDMDEPPLKTMRPALAVCS